MELKRPGFCPECKSVKVLEIVYDEVGPEIFDMPGYDEIALGGCVVEPDSPAWKCGSCGASWGIYDYRLDEQTPLT